MFLDGISHIKRSLVTMAAIFLLKKTGSLSGGHDLDRLRRRRRQGPRYKSREDLREFLT
jgi:hypothetical protein